MFESLVLSKPFTQSIKPKASSSSPYWNCGVQVGNIEEVKGKWGTGVALGPIDSFVNPPVVRQVTDPKWT